MDNKPNMAKCFLYIAQANKERGACKIGITDDLDRRLKEYNSETGRSADNLWEYLFTCETDNAKQIEDDIKKNLGRLRQKKRKEVYFYNDELFEDYITFIKTHKLFIKEVFIKKEESKKQIRIIKKATPTLGERGLTRKDLLQKAQKLNNDEFYTRYEDIEKEVAMYDKRTWNNKTVFCNCDDAVGDKESNTSAFALYFIRNFDILNLKKLICTHYGGGIDLFNQGVQGYIFTKDGYEEIGKKESPRGYSGSFDDPISLKILKEEADIVCTNPPFSKAKEYWKIMVESGKKFLIISNFTNAVTKAYLPYIKENKVWAGYNRVDWFLNPKKQITDASGHWYTNLSIDDRPKYKNMKFMPLRKIPEKYKKYDDRKVLLVDNNYIPSDYKQPFAVSAYPILSGILEKGYEMIENKEYYPYIKGKRKFARVLVQKTAISD